MKRSFTVNKHFFSVCLISIRPHWFVGKDKRKSPWSFAHVVHRDQVNTEQETQITQRDHANSFYSIVKITRLYNYQTWQTHFWRNSWCEVRKGLWSFSLLCFSGADWLSREAPVTWIRHRVYFAQINLFTAEGEFDETRIFPDPNPPNETLRCDHSMEAFHEYKLMWYYLVLWYY